MDNFPLLCESLADEDEPEQKLVEYFDILSSRMIGLRGRVTASDLRMRAEAKFSYATAKSRAIFPPAIKLLGKMYHGSGAHAVQPKELKLAGNKKPFCYRFHYKNSTVSSVRSSHSRNACFKHSLHARRYG